MYEFIHFEIEKFNYLSIILIGGLITVIIIKSKNNKLDSKEINKKIDKNNDKIMKGIIGEELIIKNINKLDIYHKIIQNVYINYDNKKTEIDIILITCTGIYIIESKNFSGTIYGKNNDFTWTQFLNSNNKKKFLNPIKQNQYHIKFLSNYLNKDEDIFNSYIVFGDNANINQISYDKKMVNIVKNEDLLINLIDDIHNKNICLSNEEIDKLYIDLKYYQEHSR